MKKLTYHEAKVKCPASFNPDEINGYARGYNEAIDEMNAEQPYFDRPDDIQARLTELEKFVDAEMKHREIREKNTAEFRKRLERLEKVQAMNEIYLGRFEQPVFTTVKDLLNSFEQRISSIQQEFDSLNNRIIELEVNFTKALKKAYDKGYCSRPT